MKLGLSLLMWFRVGPVGTVVPFLGTHEDGGHLLSVSGLFLGFQFALAHTKQISAVTVVPRRAWCLHVYGFTQTSLRCV